MCLVVFFFSNLKIVDSSGRVIVGGYTPGTWSGQSSAGDSDALLLRFSSSGSFEWAFQCGFQCGSGLADRVLGIAIDKVDSADDIYATGYTGGSFYGHTHNGGTVDIFLIKVRVESFPNSPHFYGWEMFVTKQFEQTIFSTLKVSSTKTFTWSRQVGTLSADEGHALVIDSTQNVYVSGRTNGQLGATQFANYDGFLMKYDKGGVQQWIIQFGTTGDDSPYGLCVDTNDKLYAAIQTGGSMAGTNLGSHDIAVMQVDSAGSVQWTDQFGTTGMDYIAQSGGNPITVDSAGDLFITGYTFGAFTGYSNQGSLDWFLYKMDAKTTTTTLSTSSTTWTSTSMTSSSATSSSTTFSTTSTTGSMTSTSTSSRTLVAVVAG